MRRGTQCILPCTRRWLKQTLGGLQYDPHIPRRGIGPLLRFTPLQLHNEDSALLSAGTNIFLTLSDYEAKDPQRAQMVLKHRALLEFLVRLMSAPATQWNEYYNELWEREFVKHIKYNDEHSLLTDDSLPTFVLSMKAEDISENDFDLCYEFLTRPSAQVLSSEQQELLNRVNDGVKPRQIILELGLQLLNCKLTKELIVRLQRLLARLEVTSPNDPLEIPLKFKIMTRWFGGSAFKIPCNMDVLMDLATMTGICVRGDHSMNYRMPWTHSLEEFPPRVLLNPSARRLDLSWIELTSQHFSSICLEPRVTSRRFRSHIVGPPLVSSIALCETGSGLGLRSESCTEIRTRR